MKKSRYVIPAFDEISFKVSYSEIYEKDHTVGSEPHFHSSGEIYMNVTGDISFFCEGQIYPMTRGDIFIARPGELHHCIYNSDTFHKSFWILFDYENNKDMWEKFFRTPFANVLRPDMKQKERLIEICTLLADGTFSEGEQFSLFWEMMMIIRRADVADAENGIMPAAFVEILDYIDLNVDQKISAKKICEDTFVSPSSIERYFKKYLNVRPVEYIRYKKMKRAAQLLKEGMRVSLVAEKTGYNDESYFIEIFKKTYGVTPLKFKNL